MTEQQWLSCEQPGEMLDWLLAPTKAQTTERLGTRPRIHHVEYGRTPSDRKLRLLLASMYEASTHDDYEGVQNDLQYWREGRDSPYDQNNRQADGHLRQWFDSIYDNVGDPPMALRAALLREVVGNPFRLARLPLDLTCPECDGKGGWPSSAGKRGGPGGQTITGCRRCEGQGQLCSWLSWREGTVFRIAERIYDSPDFSGMGVLGDALEEAGCTDAEILQHCRQFERCPKCLEKPGVVWGHNNVHKFSGWFECQNCKGSGQIPKRSPCVRGCWLVDLLLGKE